MPRGHEPDAGTAVTPSGRGTAWFDSLFAAHATSVHRYFVRRADRSDVEDLTAEVFATAWRRRDRIPEDHQLPWLYRTASFVLANHRRRPTLTLISEYTGDHERDHRHERTADPAELAVADDEMRRALERLRPRDRQILLLHAWEGLDGEGLARALGITRGGAAAALSRARSRLREIWDEDH